MSFFHETIFFYSNPENKALNIEKKRFFVKNKSMPYIYIYILLTVFYRKAYLFKVFQDFFCNIIEITF